MKHFDKDRFEEILQVLSQNKLRTFLTACGVFWGVFVLISMLGFGNGIQKGVNDSMGGIATNAMWVWGEATTKLQRLSARPRHQLLQRRRRSHPHHNRRCPICLPRDQRRMARWFIGTP